MKKTKKGPLSNKEKQYIEKNLDNIKNDIGKVAELMNRSVSTITKHVDSLAQPEDTSIKSGDLMARNEDRGVTVMTESASMAADESKQKRQAQNPGRYNQYIHKIKE